LYVKSGVLYILDSAGAETAIGPTGA
jgi:hypothetical protein